MATKSVEQRLDDLEETNDRLQARNEELEHEVVRQQDVHEIQNLMSRYIYLLLAREWEKMMDLFASKTPGVRASRGNWGIYDGREGVRRLYVDMHKRIEAGKPGLMICLPITTPVIEVAGDGQTAKGVWIAPGGESMEKEGKIKAFWAWCKYGVDFVKEDGKWKIWHKAVHGMFFTPYDTSWVDTPINPFFSLPDQLKADRPPTYFWMYTPDGWTDNVPAPPEPYETWDESMSYVD